MEVSNPRVSEEYRFTVGAVSLTAYWGMMEAGDGFEPSSVGYEPTKGPDYRSSIPQIVYRSGGGRVDLNAMPFGTLGFRDRDRTPSASALQITAQQIMAVSRKPALYPVELRNLDALAPNLAEPIVGSGRPEAIHRDARDQTVVREHRRPFERLAVHGLLEREVAATAIR